MKYNEPLSLLGVMISLILWGALDGYAKPKAVERIAVLELGNKAGVDEGELGYLTDLLRQAAGRLPKEHYLVMTKDNILVMLPPGKTLKDCEGTCAVDTGKRLGAHWVLVGEVVRFGVSLRVTLNLHHTSTGALRGSDVIKGRSLTDLEGPLQRSALSLFSEIDARVGRSASLARALAEIDGQATTPQGQDEDETALEDRLAALDAEDEESEESEVKSDADYEAELAELKELARLKKERELQEKRARDKHQREVDRQWVKVKKIDAKSAKRGVKALGFFLETYRSHQYGNHREEEAEQRLERSRERLIEQKRKRLEKTHRRQVETAWKKTKRLVKRGDDKAKAALAAFLKAYEGHPLGNPLSGEAEAFFEASRTERENALEAKHRAKIERSWKKTKRVVKRGDSKAKKALVAFLRAYEGQSRGNHLAEEAQRFFDESKAKWEQTRAAAHLTKVKKEWAKLRPILKAKGKTAERAIKLFIKRYQTHPQGNPLADVAQAALEANARGEDASTVNSGAGKVGKAGIRWIKIKSGRFKMGSNDGDSDEKPVHSVRVKAFLMSETEVTVGQYRKCVEAGRCEVPSSCTFGNPIWTSSPSGKEDHPINCVDWGQARTFAVWAGGDLPTEAQWEYAARGGERYKYAGSNDPDRVAWYTKNTNDSGTRSVKTKKPNAYGLYDMSGNVWEWTLDEYHSDYNGAPNKAEESWGLTPTCKQMCDKGSSRRVDRGGSWYYNAGNLRVANRTQRPRHRTATSVSVFAGRSLEFLEYLNT